MWRKERGEWSLSAGTRRGRTSRRAALFAKPQASCSLSEVVMRAFLGVATLFVPVAAASASGLVGPAAGEARVTSIPEELVKKYRLDTEFYKKHLDYKGFSILSSDKVSDEALYEARYLIHQLLG